MNAFVRRLAVLSVLWAALEMLVPERKQQPMIRMTMGVLVMSALISQAGQWLGGNTGMPAWIIRQETVLQTGYLETALRSTANQIEQYCRRQAERAGYQAEVCVWIRQDGAIDRIEISLLSEGNVLLTPEKLGQHLAHQLNVQPECIHLEGV